MDMRQQGNYRASRAPTDHEAIHYGWEALWWKYGVHRGYGPIDEPFAVAVRRHGDRTRNLADRIASPLPIK
jgi:hypothetical protein